MRTAVAILLVGALSVPRVGGAQVIEGRVVDDTGGGVADVAITVVDQPGVATLSNRRGSFALSDLPAGSLRIRFEALGYATLEATVFVYPGETTPLAVALEREAIELDAIDVTVDGGLPFLEMNGFYRRTQRGFGLQFPRSSLDELRLLEVSDAIRQTRGVRLAYDSQTGNRVIAVRPQEGRAAGRPCALTVYVDGVRTLDPNLNQVPPDWLIAMEVYVGAETPARYRTSDNCGAVLLWTRQR